MTRNDFKATNFLSYLVISERGLPRSGDPSRVLELLPIFVGAGLSRVHCNLPFASALYSAINLELAFEILRCQLGCSFIGLVEQLPVQLHRTQASTTIRGGKEFSHCCQRYADFPLGPTPKVGRSGFRRRQSRHSVACYSLPDSVHSLQDRLAPISVA